MRERKAMSRAGPAGLAIAAAAVVLVAGCATSSRAPSSLAPSSLAPSSLAPTPAAPASVAEDVPSSPAAPLTVESAVRRALDRSSLVATLRASLAIAEARLRSAGDLADPELQLGVSDGDGASDRYATGTRRTEQSSSGQQTAADTLTTAGTTTGPGGIPDSTGSSQRGTTGRTTSWSRSTQDRSSSSSGWSSEDADGYRIGLRLFVPNLWQWSPRMTARRAEIEAVRADLSAAKWAVACDVRSRFAELDYLTNDLALAEARVRLDDDIVKAVRGRVEHGAGTSADLLAATRRHLQVQNDLLQARQRYRLALRSLAVLVDMPVASLALAAGESVAPPLAPDARLSAERIEAAALDRRADLAALRWRALAAQSAYREARNARYPWIKEISASYRRARTTRHGGESSGATSHETGVSGSESSASGRTSATETSASTGSVRNTSETRTEQQSTSGTSETWSTAEGTTWTDDRSDANEWQVGLAIDVPIFTWFKNRAEDVLLAECRLAGVRESEAVRSVSSEVRDAFEEFEDSRREQAHYAKTIDPIVAEMKRALTVMENAPSVMPDQLATARLQCLESERVRIGLMNRCLAAFINLERAAGVRLAGILPFAR